MSIDTEFLDQLASKSPTPGGGGGAAATGAMAAALASMVCNLTIGKKRYAAVEPQVCALLDELTALRSRLVELIDADARAFAPLAACYSMPRETPEQQQARTTAMQAALIDACEVPLEIMATSLKVLEKCDFLAHEGSRLALSDAGCAVVLAHSAINAASLNVYINMKSLEDSKKAAQYDSQVEKILTQADILRDAIYPVVVKGIL